MSFKDFNYIPIQILEVNEYRALYDVPSSDNEVQQNQLISKWLLSAQDQLNSISNGTLYEGIDTLDPNNKKDQEEFYTVKRCIGDWVEYFILTSRIFIDRDQNVQGSVPLDLSTHANDGDVEAKRLDILRKFALTRFYKTRASQSSSSVSEKGIQSTFANIIEENKEGWFPQLVTELKSFFKTIDNSNKMVGDFTFTNNIEMPTPYSMFGVGNITSYANDLPQANWPTISGFNINANLVGTVAQSEVSLGSNKVYWQGTNEYLDIKEIPNLAYFGVAFTGYGSAVNRQEIYSLLEATVLPYQENFAYGKDVIVRNVFQLPNGDWTAFTYQSLISGNLGNDPLTSPNAWRQLVNAVEVDYNKIIDEATNRTIGNFTPLFNAYKVEIDTKIVDLKTYIDSEFVDIKSVLDTTYATFVNTINTTITTFQNQVTTQINTFINTTAPQTITDEVSKQLDALPTATIENLVYAKNTWYQFKNSYQFSLIKQEFGLLESRDFFYLDDFLTNATGKGLGFYRDNIVSQDYTPRRSGNSLLINSNYTDTKFYLRDSFVDTRDGKLFFHKSGGGMTNGRYPVVSGFWDQAPTGTTNQYFIQMNGGIQTEFIPEHIQALYVLFTKDIVRSQKAIIRAEISWGDIKGNIDNQGDLWGMLLRNENDIVNNQLGIRANIDAIATTNTKVETNKTNITANTTKINANTTNIAANTTKIETNITNIMLNTASIGDATTKLTQLETTTANLIAKVDRTFAYNVEFATGEMLGNKPIYAQLISKGDIKSNNDIPASGDLVSGVDLFLGIEWGVISRKSNLQIHNMDCVNNLPDQHVSIVYQDGGTNIKWHFNANMVLTSFKNRPFIALIKYTKV